MNADVEAERIRREYRRRESEIAPDFYSLRRPENLFFRHGQERAILAGLQRAEMLPPGERRLLEIGCGDGQWLGLFDEFGFKPENVAGIELDEKRYGEAQRRHPAADLRQGNAAELPWPDASFDVVFQSTVFTSVLDETVRQSIAREMLRVLRPSGVVLWYDFQYDNPRNPNVRKVTVRDVRRLFPGCRVWSRRVTLAPPLARRIVPWSWSLGSLLEMLKVFNTHLSAVIRRD